MRKIILTLVTPLLMGVSVLASCSGVAQTSSENNDTTTFKVYGNCGMCEKTIEGSLNGKKGVEDADWDKETKMITVIYDSEKITVDQIKEKIAGVGYDTDSHRAEEGTYNELPGCCQYDRPE